MSDRTRLILLSFVMLFTELALIRWAGANVLYLSYFSNFVLLGSFLGIGLGFLRGDSKRDLFPFAPVALAAFIVLILVLPVRLERPSGPVLYFGIQAGGPPAWVLLPLIFVAVAAVLAMIAQGVARVFSRFEPLEAYRLDILGSILGIAGFSALSFLHAPPVVWGVVVAVMLLVLAERRRIPQVLGAVAIVAALAVESLTPGHSWSPYYEVTVSETRTQQGPIYHLAVNGIPHQDIESKEIRRAIEPVYFTPYERKASPALDDVLVVGAGNGTDVAIALSEGARSIDAVEIDPRIVELGRELNPDRPYADPRVRTHIGDGRAFLENTDKTYDLILFALPDSLTLVAGQSAVRLESYLFTLEAMESVRSRLKPDGMFAMYNFYRERWLIDRYASTVATAFGRTPCVDLVERTNFALITASTAEDGLRCPERWSPSGAVPAPAVDDHPFPYLRSAGVPFYYVGVLALILAASMLAVRRTTGTRLRTMRPYVDLFFMGAAFLLLETKNVVQFALLFGTTWFVNALVFGGILVSVLAAIEVARRLPSRAMKPMYALLFVSVLVAWLVPHASLLAMPAIPRFAAATALAFAPIFLANLIFAERFRSVGSSTVAFGANLLGAMVGGTLEYAALAIGYRSLLVVVAILYGLAFLTRPRGIEDATAGEAASVQPA